MSAMSAAKLGLEWIPGSFAVCRLDPCDQVPGWASGTGDGDGDSALLCITRTDRELSIVAPSTAVPDGVRAERGWVALRVAGTLDFGLVGVLSVLTGALASAGVPVFVVSTYESDIVLVKSVDAQRAVEALASVADVAKIRSAI